MKFIFTLLPLWLLAIGAQIACAVNSLEQEFLCPICGTHWEQRIETSGRARGLRLDLRQVGDVVDPPSLPQCTKCRFPLFSERLAAQASDPAKAQAFRQLRSFVRGADFQMLASKNPSYFALAQVQELLKAPHRNIALSYLRASWQAEDREAVCRRLLEKAHEHYVAALAEAGTDDRLHRDLALLCGEAERRLGKWEDAEKRFRELESSAAMKGTPQANIPALQLRLIAQHDSAPHLIDGADAAENREPKNATPPDEKPMFHLENPGRAERPEDALKLAQPPKPPRACHHRLRRRTIQSLIYPGIRTDNFNMTAQPLSRRTFLHGLGVTMALPFLEAMLPRAASAATAARAPVRTAFFYVPNGVNMTDWTPKQFGADFQLPYILEPLQAHKNDVLVLTGLAQDKGRANGDGAGDHARAASTWLTGAQPLKSESSRIRSGVSADQVMAGAIGRQTRFPSIELGVEPARQGGKCDSGYACAYSNNISWRSDATPSGAEINPRLVFERLFASSNPKLASEGSARRERQRKGILDFVLEDARTLSAKVGGSDRQKLDEYLTAVREIEQRVEAAQRSVAAVQNSGAIEAYDVPEAIPESYEEHARLMLDMVALAFQTDSTRIATCMLANEGSNRSYRNLSITRGHHELSHHQGNAENLRQIREINRFHMRQFAYLLGKLKGMPEGDGTVLDNTMLLYGAALADGNRHEHENLPLILAGRGGGTIMTGRHMRYPSETPMCNLLLTMMGKAGVAAPRHGDSTGTLRGLEG